MRRSAGHHPGVEALVNLSRFASAHVRTTADWPGTSASFPGAVCSLARHLVCEYRVPAFLAGTRYSQTRCRAREHTAPGNDADVPGQSAVVRTCALANRGGLDERFDAGMVAARRSAHARPRHSMLDTQSSKRAECPLKRARPCGRQAYAWLNAGGGCLWWRTKRSAPKTRCPPFVLITGPLQLSSARGTPHRCRCGGTTPDRTWGRSACGQN